jgi:NADH-quinone oxidoreductase subunit J
MIPTALFWGFGALLLASSLLVILHKNPVTSALFLVLAFCSLAGIYLTLQAEFLGMVQIIVYAGAIMVLFLFVIMYLNLGRDVESGVQIAFRRGAGWILGGLLVGMGVLLLSRGWAIGPGAATPPDPTVGNTQAIGLVLYSRYLFPFELTSIVLLVAMVGAVVIARGRLGPAPRNVSQDRGTARVLPGAPEPLRSAAIGAARGRAAAGSAPAAPADPEPVAAEADRP